MKESVSHQAPKVMYAPSFSKFRIATHEQARM